MGRECTKRLSMWKPKLRNVIVGLVLVCHLANADIFSSTAHLQHLLHLESHLAKMLDEYVYKMENKLSHIRTYLNDYVNAITPPDENSTDVSRDDFVTNPLQAFHVIKRLTVDWKNIKEAIHDDDWNKIEQLTAEHHPILPRDEDLHSAALGLIRLQDVYQLNMSRMSAGDILGIRSPLRLSARDCLYLGKHAFNNGYYGRAIEWFDHSLSLASAEESPTVMVDEVEPFMKTAIDVHDEVFQQDNGKDETVDTLGHDVRLTGDTKRHVTQEPRKVRLGLLRSDNDDYLNFADLCRGKKLQSERQQSRLKCFYSSRSEPYLLLQPVKVEEHNLDPQILQFHDLMSDAEAELVVDLASPKLERALVQGRGEVTREVSVHRTSRTAWLSPNVHPVIERLHRRVSMVTGLSTDVSRDHSEVMQVANYGIGGFYQPHCDYLFVDKTEDELKNVEPKELQSGDRTATLMFYLSNVTRGGATVFPRIGTGLWPKKGSAVFWYNLKKNGKGNPLTLHGACPVVHSQKWVANYWIREKGQVFRRPCDLEDV